MKALFWPYRFKDMKVTWAEQTLWIANALKALGFTILRQKDFVCNGLDAAVYSPSEDRNGIDLIIYNHADISEIHGNVVPAKNTLFMKPTVPTPKHTTLDTMGYGPYSSIAYTRPLFDDVPERVVDMFFNIKVAGWIASKASKWETFKTEDIAISYNDYYLLIGQCGGDSVVTRHEFGNYWSRLQAVAAELVKLGDRPVIVKLHPYTDGKDPAITGPDSLSTQMAAKLREAGCIVYTGRANIHDFISKAHSVWLANSGAGFEAMMHHKPIISWGYPEYHWVTFDLRHLAGTREAAGLAWFRPQAQDAFLYWYMEKYTFCDEVSASRRVRELLCGGGS